VTLSERCILIPVPENNRPCGNRRTAGIAIGSRRTLPTAPAAAAVISEPMVAPMYTPELQFERLIDERHRSCTSPTKK